jgi:hypothetical protein
MSYWLKWSECLSLYWMISFEWITSLSIKSFTLHSVK